MQKNSNYTLYVNGRFLSQPITGVQRFAIEISKELARLPVKVVLLCPKNCKIAGSHPLFDIKIVGNKTGYYWEQVELPQWMKKNTSGAPLLNLCNLAPVFYKNNFVTIHDIAVLVNPRWFSKNFYYSYKLLFPLIARKAKHVFTVSLFSKSEIVRHFKLNENKVSVVYNGNAHLPAVVAGNSDFEYAGQSYALAVSSINPRKNFEAVLKAFEQVNSNIKLLVAGEPYKSFASSDLKISERNKDRVHFLGYVDDELLTQLYKNALVFVYPSLYEGFGIPPVEAMNFDCPVIASDTSSLPEICGDAALYVDPHVPSQIAEAVERIYADNNLRNLLIAKGRQQVMKYSWENSAIQILETIKTHP